MSEPKKECSSCHGLSKDALLTGERLRQYFSQLKGWTLVGEHHLEKEYVFSNFKKALSFVNSMGEIAEQEGHHPDLFLSYGKVKVQIWTHKIGGLSEKDFVLASRCDEIGIT